MEHGAAALHDKQLKMLMPVQVQNTVAGAGGKAAVLKKLKRISGILQRGIFP
ncbi:hypothetical protein [Paenibacillus sp. OAE614]|uniref:hypothetical protein n=1 Tax=Paenibacillus sp. OAE614 TaxID=2663804 RepID=UPI00339AB172